MFVAKHLRRLIFIITFMHVICLDPYNGPCFPRGSAGWSNSLVICSRLSTGHLLQGGFLWIKEQPDAVDGVLPYMWAAYVCITPYACSPFLP